MASTGREGTTSEDARGRNVDDAELHREVRALFHELHDLEPAEREARLAVLNPTASVRAALEELLGLAERPDALEDARLGELAEELLSPAGSEEPVLPERIGEYAILGKLGEGGMGVVYSGRREGSDETVAIKIIRPGVDATRMSSRFRREIQVLEQLHHPGIAAFHGAGEASLVSPAGEVTLPYLVMELVEGEPVLAHAERRSLSDRERIELVVRIASALHHAHELGVVHRDLKPANVLVERSKGDPVGQPKLLDFGVALALDTELATLTVTQTGALIGTLPYMSPEQVRGEGLRVDRTSDVYSLGVLSFELLSGRLPYEVRNRPLVEAARVIQEEDPSRLGSVVARHRGALELIVAQSLEKDPSRRYPTALAFAEDLERYLRSESVHARRTTMTRELRKLARRHRVLFAVAIATLLTLSIGLAASIWFALGESSARRLADERTLDATRNLYRASLRSASDAIADGHASLAVLELERAPPELRGWEWGLLESRVDASAIRFEIEALAPSVGQGGRKLAFGRDGRSLTLRDGARCFHWDLDSGVATRLEVPERSTLGPYGERTAEIEDGELVVTSLLSAERLASVELSEPLPPTNLRFLEKGFVLRSGRSVYWIDPASGEVEGPEDLGKKPKWSMDVDQHWIAFRSSQHLSVRETSTGKTSSLGPGWVDSRISPDGRHLAGVARDGRMTLWRLATGDAPQLAWRRRGERNQLRALAFSPDSKRLATAGVTPSVDVWDTESGELFSSLTGQRSIVRALAFSPDGELLASAADDGDVRIWRVDDDSNVIRVGRYAYAVAFDASGERMVAGNNNGELLVLDARSSSEIGRLDLGRGVVLSLDVHAGTGRCVAAIRRPASTIVLDLATAEVLWSRAHSDKSRLLKASFSADGQRVVVAGPGGFLSTWDAATGEPLASVHGEALDLPQKGMPHFALSVDPHTGWIAYGEGNAVGLFDAETLAQRAELAGDGGGIVDAAFSPDGTWLATASEDHLVRVWDVPSRELVASLAGHSQTVLGVCWAPDGSRLFSSSWDTTIRVWDTASWTDVVALPGHRDYVFSVEMNAAGDTLLSCGGDGTARLWRRETAAERWAEQRRYAETATRLRSVVSSGSYRAFEERAAAIRGAEELDAREREIALQMLLGQRMRAED